MIAPHSSTVRARSWLIAGATGSFAIAVLHIVVIFVGARGYRYFGAPSLAVRLEQGSLAPTFITAAIALVFAAWGAYALSGAGVFVPFPFLRAVLVVISVVYVLRGLPLFPALVQAVKGTPYASRQAAFSAVALLIGIVHVCGLLARGQR